MLALLGVLLVVAHDLDLENVPPSEVDHRFPAKYRLGLGAVGTGNAHTILRFSKPHLRIVHLDLMKFGTIRDHFGEVGTGIKSAHSRLEQLIARTEADPATLATIEKVAKDFNEGDLSIRDDIEATAENYQDDFHDYRPSHTSLDCPEVGWGKPDRFGHDHMWGFIKRGASNYYVRLMIDPDDSRHPIIGFQIISWG